MAERGRLGQGLKRFGMLMATAGLAGCAVVPKVPQGPVAPPPPPVQAPRPTTPAPLPEDVARNRVALLVPMTGPQSAAGISIANAATMAVLDTGGKAIRVTTYDTAAAGARAAAERALAEGNGVILGPLFADDARAIAPLARAARVPVVSFSNDSGIAGDGVFVMGYAPAQSIRRVVGYAREKGMTSYAGLIPSGVYGDRASTAYLRAVEDNGGKVVALQTYDRAPASIRAAVGRLGDAPVQALLIADGARAALTAQPLLAQQGKGGVTILGTELWNVDGAIASNVALRGALFASVSDGLYTQLRSKYQARYNRAPYRLASLGYDAVLLVTNIARDWRVGAPFPTARLFDQGGFTGIDGAFRFGRDGVAERALEVQQAGPNGFTVVSPAPRGF